MGGVLPRSNPRMTGNWIDLQCNTQQQNSPETPPLAFPRPMGLPTRPTPRAARIKERLLENERQIDVERARFTTESYRATEGQPMPIRRAQMLLHLVRTLSITIEPDELIVGNRSLLPRMGVIAPEGAVDWVDRELEKLPTRPAGSVQHQRRSKSPSCARRSSPIGGARRWKTSSPSVCRRMWRVAVRGKAFSLNQTDHAQGHILPDVEGWLRLGIGGLRQRVLFARRQRQVQTADAAGSIYDAALIGAPGGSRVYGALRRAG